MAVTLLRLVALALAIIGGAVGLHSYSAPSGAPAFVRLQLPTGQPARAPRLSFNGPSDAHTASGPGHAAAQMPPADTLIIAAYRPIDVGRLHVGVPTESRSWTDDEPHESVLAQAQPKPAQPRPKTKRKRHRTQFARPACPWACRLDRRLAWMRRAFEGGV